MESEDRQKTVCYRGGNETWGLNTGKERGSEDLKVSFLLHWQTYFSDRLGCWVPRECLLDLWTGTMG